MARGHVHEEWRWGTFMSAGEDSLCRWVIAVKFRTNDDDQHHHQNYDQIYTSPQGPGRNPPTPSVGSLAIFRPTKRRWVHWVISMYIQVPGTGVFVRSLYPIAVSWMLSSSRRRFRFCCLRFDHGDFNDTCTWTPNNFFAFW